MKELQVTAIKNGVVIDHIPSKEVFKLAEMLHLREYDHVVTMAFNLKSKSMNKKALIKISDRELTSVELYKISVVAPSATVNTIRNYEVADKKLLQIPDIIENIIKCNNYNCISNHEDMESKFLKIEEDGKIKFRCFFCERILVDDVNPLD